MARKDRWSLVLILVAIAGAIALVRSFRPKPDPYAVQREIEAALSVKNFELASQLADRQLKADPRNSIALLQRGRICAAQSQWEQALEFFGRIPDDSMSAADARYFEGLTHLEMQRSVPA